MSGQRSVDSAALTTPRPAVVLLSGGLDSATVLAMARAQGFACHALAFRYGQRHAVELQYAERVAQRYGAVSFRIVDLDLRAFGGSALTSDVPVPKGRALHDENDIPTTYVPARNTIFLSFALALCEVLHGRDIFIGANALDYSGYPDCRPAFITAFEEVANLGTRAGTGATRIRVHAPLLAMSKADIIVAGTALGVDYALTWSCYDPQARDDTAKACGGCDACVLRRRGFASAGVLDPTPYALASSTA